MVDDIDCEQSLFCSKICGEECKECNSHELWGHECASVIYKPAPLLMAHGFSACHSHVTFVLLSSLRSSPWISVQKRDCAQSIEDIKINNV